MNNSKVELFYEFLKNNSELLEKVKKELEKLPDNKISPEFIRNDIISIAKKNNFDITVEDILEYENSVASKLKNISEEELYNVSGGKMDSKSIASGVLSLTLLCGATGFGGTAHAMSPETVSTTTSYSVSQMAKDALGTAGSVITWPLAKIWSVIYPDPAKPVVTQGKFPFKLVYEINGERKIVEDTLICKFDGFGWNEGNGKYRKWKGSLASGNEKVILLQINDNNFIYYNPGYPGYYMGEETYMGAEFPDATHFIKNNNEDLFRKIFPETSSGTIKAEELLNKYKIKLISWDCAQPIVNEFK